MPASGNNATWDDPRGRVWLPRWIIYAQATLLGVATVTAFIFGLMVGSITTPQGKGPVQLVCSLRGAVQAGRGAAAQPDANAIVILIPVDAQPKSRLDPEWIAPGTYQPLNNPIIDQIQSWGGAVTRTDDRGAFAVQLDSPRRYWLIIVSQQFARGTPLQMTRQEMATAGKYFVPVEGLFRDRRWAIIPLSLTGTSETLPAVQW